MEHVRPALAEAGDAEQVEALWAALRSRGTGSEAQRAWAEQGELRPVVRRAVEATLR